MFVRNLVYAISYSHFKPPILPLFAGTDMRLHLHNYNSAESYFFIITFIIYLFFKLLKEKKIFPPADVSFHGHPLTCDNIGSNNFYFYFCQLKKNPNENGWNVYEMPNIVVWSVRNSPHVTSIFESLPNFIFSFCTYCCLDSGEGATPRKLLTMGPLVRKFHVDEGTSSEEQQKSDQISPEQLRHILDASIQRQVSVMIF